MSKLKSFKEYHSDVIIFPGRFMPFHNGHLIAIENAYSNFKTPIVPIQIISKKGNFFTEPLLQDIGNDIVVSNECIKKWICYPSDRLTVIPQMVKYVKELGLNPIGVICGDDRLKDYKQQVDYLLSDRSDVKVNGFFVESVMSRTDNGPSATKVRNLLQIDDYDNFQHAVPQEIWKYYDRLKTELKQ